MLNEFNLVKKMKEKEEKDKEKEIKEKKAKDSTKVGIYINYFGEIGEKDEDR